MSNAFSDPRNLDLATLVAPHLLQLGFTELVKTVYFINSGSLEVVRSLILNSKASYLFYASSVTQPIDAFLTL